MSICDPDGGFSAEDHLQPGGFRPVVAGNATQQVSSAITSMRHDILRNLRLSAVGINIKLFSENIASLIVIMAQSCRHHAGAKNRMANLRHSATAICRQVCNYSLLLLSFSKLVISGCRFLTQYARLPLFLLLRHEKRAMCRDTLQQFPLSR